MARVQTPAYSSSPNAACDAALNGRRAVDVRSFRAGGQPLQRQPLSLDVDIGSEPQAVAVRGGDPTKTHGVLRAPVRVIQDAVTSIGTTRLAIARGRRAGPCDRGGQGASQTLAMNTPTINARPGRFN